MRFTITTHDGIEGVRLSLSGNWGGMEFPDDQAAVRAAETHAARNHYSIVREHIKPRRKA